MTTFRKIKRYNCGTCLKGFAKNGKSLVDHQAKCAEGKKNLECITCRRTFDSLQDVTDHWRIKHSKIITEVTVYCCGKCGKNFKSKGSRYTTHTNKCQGIVDVHPDTDEEDNNRNDSTGWKDPMLSDPDVVDVLALSNKDIYNGPKKISKCKKCTVVLEEDDYTYSCINCGLIIGTGEWEPDEPEEEKKQYVFSVGYKKEKYHTGLLNKMRGLDEDGYKIHIDKDFAFQIYDKLKNPVTWPMIYSAYKEVNWPGENMSWWFSAWKIFNLKVPVVKADNLIQVDMIRAYYRERKDTPVSFWYVLYKVLECTSDQDLTAIPLKASDKILRDYDGIWIHVCKKYGWNFTRTLKPKFTADFIDLKKKWISYDEGILRDTGQPIKYPLKLSCPPYDLNPRTDCPRWSKRFFQRDLLVLKETVCKFMRLVNLKGLRNLGYDLFRRCELLFRDFYFYLKVQPVHKYIDQVKIYWILTNEQQLSLDYTYYVQGLTKEREYNVHPTHQSMDVMLWLGDCKRWIDIKFKEYERKGDLYIDPPPADSNLEYMNPFKIVFSHIDFDDVDEDSLCYCDFCVGCSVTNLTF